MEELIAKYENGDFPPEYQETYLGHVTMEVTGELVILIDLAGVTNVF